MAKIRKEGVTVSFHYLCRMLKDDNGDASQFVPFGIDEFNNLFLSIKNKPPIDLKNENSLNRLRARIEVPLEKTVRINDRTISGIFRASYSGHAYDNTAKGRIPADSVSLRPFQYLLYLSDSGRIYIGSQYLGLFGGYLALQSTVRSLLKRSEMVVSRSFSLPSSHYRNAIAKEIRVSFSERSSSISAKNRFTKAGVIAFKKTDKEDGFEHEVSKRFFPFFGKPIDEVKRGVAKIISESDLIDVDDDDIDDCTIIATVNGKRKTINLLDAGGFASRFPIDVPLDKDGHPKPEPTIKAMLELLKTEIIARKEDV